MPEPTTLNAADIRRAYICPTWFGANANKFHIWDSPQEITRQWIEWFLPTVLAQPSKQITQECILGCLDEYNPKLEESWSLADPEHRGLLEDVWLREKNLFVGVAAFVSLHLLSAPPSFVPSRCPTILRSSDGGAYDFQPCAVGRPDSGQAVVRFKVSSAASDEQQIRADCALGCEAHSLNAMNNIAGFIVQEIVIGRRAEQWYENPLCRYWRHDNGSVSITGLTPDGKQCRAPHWRKVPVFSPESTDPNEIETMWAHVEWLMKQSEFNPGEILPDPVVMEIGDHQQYQFVDALRVLEQGFAETPARNYLACDNPLFFPHGCPLKKECWG